MEIIKMWAHQVKLYARANVYKYKVKIGYPIKMNDAKVIQITCMVRTNKIRFITGGKHIPHSYAKNALLVSNQNPRQCKTARTGEHVG